MTHTIPILSICTLVSISSLGCGKLDIATEDLSAVPSLELSFDRQSLSISEGSGAVIAVIQSEIRDVDTVATISLGSLREDQDLDFTETPAAVTIPAGSLAASIELTNFDDALQEYEEDFELSITSEDADVGISSTPLLIIVSDND